jgi:hypothetical protein
MADTPSVNKMAALTQLNMGRILHPLALLATAISVYLHARQFFFPDFVLRYNPDEAYVVILAAYAGHRELRRWSNDPTVITQRARRGEFFVIGWWTAYFVAILIANHALRYRLPDGLFALCAQITAIFFGTLASQQVYRGKRSAASDVGRGTTGGSSLEDRILVHLKDASRPVMRRELEEILGVSRATVTRSLDDLEKQGKVVWAGESQNDPNGGFRSR